MLKNTSDMRRKNKTTKMNQSNGTLMNKNFDETWKNNSVRYNLRKKNNYNNEDITYDRDNNITPINNVFNTCREMNIQQETLEIKPKECYIIVENMKNENEIKVKNTKNCPDIPYCSENSTVDTLLTAPNIRKKQNSRSIVQPPPASRIPAISNTGKKGRKRKKKHFVRTTRTNKVAKTITVSNVHDALMNAVVSDEHLNVEFVEKQKDLCDKIICNSSEILPIKNEEQNVPQNSAYKKTINKTLTSLRYSPVPIVINNEPLKIVENETHKNLPNSNEINDNNLKDNSEKETTSEMSQLQNAEKPLLNLLNKNSDLRTILNKTKANKLGKFKTQASKSKVSSWESISPIKTRNQIVINENILLNNSHICDKILNKYDQSMTTSYLSENKDDNNLHPGHGNIVNDDCGTRVINSSQQQEDQIMQDTLSLYASTFDESERSVPLAILDSVSKQNGTKVLKWVQTQQFKQSERDEDRNVTTQKSFNLNLNEHETKLSSPSKAIDFSKSTEKNDSNTFSNKNVHYFFNLFNRYMCRYFFKSERCIYKRCYFSHSLPNFMKTVYIKMSLEDCKCIYEKSQINKNLFFALLPQYINKLSLEMKPKEIIALIDDIMKYEHFNRSQYFDDIVWTLVGMGKSFPDAILGILDSQKNKNNICINEILLNIVVKNREHLERNWHLVKKLTKDLESEIDFGIVSDMLTICLEKESSQYRLCKQICEDILSKFSVDFSNVSSVIITDFISLLKKVDLVKYANQIKQYFEKDGLKSTIILSQESLNSAREPLSPIASDEKTTEQYSFIEGVAVESSFDVDNTETIDLKSTAVSKSSVIQQPIVDSPSYFELPTCYCSSSSHSSVLNSYKPSKVSANEIVEGMNHLNDFDNNNSFPTNQNLNMEADMLESDILKLNKAIINESIDGLIGLMHVYKHRPFRKTFVLNCSVLLKKLKKVSLIMSLIRYLDKDEDLVYLMEMLAVNVVEYLTADGHWNQACLLLKSFKNLERVITSECYVRKKSVLQRFFFFCSILLKEKELHDVLNLLKNSKINLLDSTSWNIGDSENKEALFEQQSKFIDEFFSTALTNKLLILASDLLCHILKNKYVMPIDIWKYLRSVIQEMQKDLDTYSKELIAITSFMVNNRLIRKIPVDILRNQIVFMCKSGFEELGIKLYQRCCRSEVYYDNYLGDERAIIIRIDMFLEEIYLIFSDFFHKLAEGKFEVADINVYLCLPLSCDEAGSLNLSLSECDVVKLKKDIQKILTCFDKPVLVDMSENNTNIVIKHVNLIEYINFLRSL